MSQCQNDEVIIMDSTMRVRRLVMNKDLTELKVVSEGEVSEEGSAWAKQMGDIGCQNMITMS